MPPRRAAAAAAAVAAAPSANASTASTDAPSTGRPKRAAAVASTLKRQASDDVPAPAAAPAKRTKAAAAKVVDLTDDKDDKNVKAPTAKGRGRGKAAAADQTVVDPPSASASTSLPPAADPAEPEEKVLVKKMIHVDARAPVDEQCPWYGSARVYEDGDNVYDCMLNQTDISYGVLGHNKFYLIQVVENTKTGQSAVWLRWGRVGAKGQTNLQTMGSASAAVDFFKRKFSDKTRNRWEDHAHFTHVPGMYDLVHRDHAAGGGDEPAPAASKPGENEAPLPPPESKLDEPVQRLIELIFNVRAMEEAMLEMEYDTAKAPLGKLTKKQVLNGYAALKTIEELVNAGKTSGAEISQACSLFYTRIPHNFGMRKPPLINTLQAVANKMKLLEALGEIEVAMTALSHTAQSHIHPVDRKYESLRCDIKPVAPTSDVFGMVERYMQNTHASTHASYTLDLVDLFEVSREGEDARFVGDAISNHQLLWHGSRTTNFAGILSQGLRIAPPEAPSTGYMFGKGVYFADMVSKSANYCFTSKNNATGCLLLCEVALGETNDLTQANYNASKLPKGKHSTKGIGSTAPDPSGSLTYDMFFR